MRQIHKEMILRLKTIIGKIGLLLIIIPMSLSGQEQDFPAVLASQLHQENVYLRWVPNGHDLWVHGMDVGYHITRTTLAINDVPLSEQEQETSKVILAFGIKPLAETDWNSNSFQDPELAEAGKQLLYSDAFDATFTPSSFEEVVELYETKSNKFTFSLMLADRGFELAEAFALGIKDVNVDSKAEYLYSLAFTDNPESIISSTFIDLSNAKELNPVKELKAYGSDLSIVLEWENSPTTNQYSSYFIERSTDGVQFELLNETPYVYSQDIKTTNHSDKAYFKDSIPQNEVDYYYRIKGFSPFGIEGPVSEVVKGQGIPGRMDIELTAAVSSESPELVVIKWGGISEEQEQYIEKFEVHRSSEIHEGFVNISGASLSKSDREFYDQDPLYAGYYIITMIDVNGHYYKSRVILAQPTDDIPPAIPSGLSATVEKSGAIHLSWNANSEEDFEAYRLFRSNLREGGYVDG